MKELCLLIVVALVCIIVLSACGKEQTKTYEGDASDKHVLTSITYKDDKVLKQSTIDATKYNDPGIDKDEAKRLFAESGSILKDPEGVKYKVNYKDERAVEYLDMDYTEVSMKKLSKRLGIPTKENKDISFEKLERQLKHRGLEGKDKMGNK